MFGDLDAAVRQHLYAYEDRMRAKSAKVRQQYEDGLITFDDLVCELTRCWNGED